MMYKQIAINGVVQPFVQRLEDTAFIPFDMGNGDYIQYLNWLAEGNTPEPADEPAQGE